MFLKNYFQSSCVVVMFTLFVAILECVSAQENPYIELAEWMQPLPSRALGSVSGVYEDAEGDYWTTERCGANSCLDRDDVSPIHVYDSSGRWVKSFGDGMFVWPHGIYIDVDGNIWVTDARGDDQRGYQVFKFSPDGEVLMTLGEAGVAGNDPDHFSAPTDVHVAPNGDIFVSDGHEADSGNRVLKFSSDGQFIKSWGTSGSAAGEFRVAHDLEMDSQGRLFVADRDNNRIQIFNQEGEFLEEWGQYGRPSGLYITDDDTIYVSDNLSTEENNPGGQRGIRIGDASDGTIKAFIPEPPLDPGDTRTTGPHGLYVNGLGEIFGADVQAETVRKFVLR
ncbi:MAG: hypothetical protein HOM55_00645 [Proteobacteria bacterium]|jgi:outer membrane protein assembly factor BamB|nr:hypothetical protein [Pseudomonadota bacterium]